MDFSASFVEQIPYFDPAGVFKGEHVFTQKWIGPRTNIGQDIITRLLDIPELDSNSIDGIQILEAQKPFDVHSDYILTDHQVPISDPEKCKPTYTVVTVGTFETAKRNPQAFNFVSRYHTPSRSRSLWIDGKRTDLPTGDPGGEHE